MLSLKLQYIFSYFLNNFAKLILINEKQIDRFNCGCDNKVAHRCFNTYEHNNRRASYNISLAAIATANVYPTAWIGADSLSAVSSTGNAASTVTGSVHKLRNGTTGSFLQSAAEQPSANTGTICDTPGTARVKSIPTTAICITVHHISAKCNHDNVTTGSNLHSTATAAANTTAKIFQPSSIEIISKCKTDC